MMLLALLAHTLGAIFLLGAVSHQAASLFRSSEGGRAGLASSFMRVRGPVYATSVTVAYLLTMLLGDIVYAPYRVDVKTMLFDLEFWSWNGLFEIKEHLVALGLFLLPGYWLAWRTPLEASLAAARRWLTLLLAGIVWYALIAGHLLNNLKGVGVL